MPDTAESALLAQHFTPDALAAAAAAGRDPWCWRNAVYVRCTECAHWRDACALGYAVTTPDEPGICNRYSHLPTEEIA